MQALSGCNKVKKSSQQIRLGYPMQAAHNMYIHIYTSSTKHLDVGHSGIPGSRSTHTFQNHQVSARIPTPHTSAAQGRKFALEGGRNQVSLLYENEAGSRVVQDRVRGYTYCFHPTRVVHLAPLKSKSARRDPTEQRDTDLMSQN